MPAHPPRLVAVLASGLLVLAGCGLSGDGAAIGIPARFLDQKPTWGPCAAGTEPALDCTTLQVPMDYTNPDGPTVTLALARQQARDPAARMGTLFVETADAGASGIAALPDAARRLGDDLARRFDLVAFDPRGVGASTPSVSCSSPAEIDDARAAPVDAREAVEQAFARRCSDRVGRGVLANSGTRDVARDLFVAQHVLRDRALSFWGSSYGASVGAEFAAQFPDDVRALALLDPPTPPTTPSGDALARAAALQRAFTGFVGACAGSGGACPLGTEPEAAAERLRRLLAPLAGAPARTERAGRHLGHADAATAVATALTSRPAWPALTAALTGLAGGDGTGLLDLADAHFARQDDGGYAHDREAATAVRCLDAPAVTDRAEALAVRLQARQVAPVTAALEPTLDGTLGPCAFWPVPVTGRTGPADDLPTPLVPPPLVVAALDDPTRPPANATALTDRLHARLLGVTGSAPGTDPCVAAAVSRYLADLTLPDPDLRCTAPPAASGG